jgi:hypothetical protein
VLVLQLRGLGEVLTPPHCIILQFYETLHTASELELIVWYDAISGNGQEARDRDRWLALVNAVMNIRVSKNAGNLLTS